MSARELGAQSASPLMPPLHEATGQSADGYPFPESGLTKREHYASMAMQGVVSDSRFMDALAATVTSTGMDPHSTDGCNLVRKLVAVASVGLADALLVELARPQA